MDAEDARFPIVVIGGSAGALEALQQISADLPADFSGAVFIATHVPPDAVSSLPHLVGQRGSLFAAHGIDRAPIAPGRIIIAPPNHHLAISDGVMRVVNGPTENGSRPSIDVLFRSAAAFGPWVCAVLVSGTLDDGVAGMVAIHEAGGTTIVQDPDDAAFPDMPRNAIASGIVDRVVPAGKIVSEILAWRQALPQNGAEHPSAPKDPRRAGVPSVFTCPDCGGTLWELEEDAVLRFCCRVGHAYSAKSMLQLHGRSIEAALWTAIRALEERHDLLLRVAKRAQRSESENPRLMRRLEEKADEMRGYIQQLQSAVTSIAQEAGAPANNGS